MSASFIELQISSTANEIPPLVMETRSRCSGKCYKVYQVGLMIVVVGGLFAIFGAFAVCNNRNGLSAFSACWKKSSLFQGGIWTVIVGFILGVIAACFDG